MNLVNCVGINLYCYIYSGLSNPKTSINIALIIGSILGGVGGLALLIFIVLAVLLILYTTKRRKRQAIIILLH